MWARRESEIMWPGGLRRHRSHGRVTATPESRDPGSPDTDTTTTLSTNLKELKQGPETARASQLGIAQPGFWWGTWPLSQATGRCAMSTVSSPYTNVSNRTITLDTNNQRAKTEASDRAAVLLPVRADQNRCSVKVGKGPIWRQQLTTVALWNLR